MIAAGASHPPYPDSFGFHEILRAIRESPLQSRRGFVYNFEGRCGHRPLQLNEKLQQISFFSLIEGENMINTPSASLSLASSL